MDSSRVPQEGSGMQTRLLIAERWPAYFGLLLCTLAPDCFGEERLCGVNSKAEFSVGMVVKEERAYFYSGPADPAASAKRKPGSLTRGDVVFVRLPDVAGNGDVAGWPPLVCTVYPAAHGRKTYGWLRKDALLELGIVRRFTGAQANPSNEIDPSPEKEEFLSQLPQVASWPRGGVTPYPSYYEDFIGNYLCVSETDFAAKKLCLATSSRWIGHDDECGVLSSSNRVVEFETEGRFDAYLLNNAIVVYSERGSWGNHGQSDPEGVYLLSEIADRACDAGEAGPSLGKRDDRIMPGRGLGKLFLSAIRGDPNYVQKILGEPAYGDADGKLLLYHSPKTGYDLLIDTSAPAIEFTSPKFVTSRGIGIDSFQYYPELFNRERDEAGGGTRHVFKLGGLAFFVYDEPRITDEGTVSKVGMIGPNAGTRIPALAHSKSLGHNR